MKADKQAGLMTKMASPIIGALLLVILSIPVLTYATSNARGYKT